MNVKISDSWLEVLKSEFKKEYFGNLVEFVKSEYLNNTVYPPGPLIFNAFNHCSFNDLKVVILGQDPYHTPGVANGLSFSANADKKVPPSLQNIYKELSDDLSIPIYTNPDLTRWADQGVLLLNAVLTVRKANPGSHQGKGWEIFTDQIIKLISNKKENVVFILWGAFAQKKESLIDNAKHYVIKSTHPSPFSAHNGFFGSKPFSKTNNYLIEKGLTPINW